ncbi:MAG: hypothetical protein ACXVCY_14145 [Pseudobdellovibrionaceae bacterium]
MNSKTAFFKILLVKWFKFSLLTLFTLTFSTNALAKVRIAFLETYNSKGELVQYEPGGRFSHTAIQFDDIGDKWLNSYPHEGVAIITWEQLQQRGVVADIIEIPTEIHLAKVTPYLGRPFDFWYSWSDDAFYCTELIGKLLGLMPQPMTFNKKVWPPSYWKLDGTLGLSPDQLWNWARSYQAGT